MKRISVKEIKEDTFYINYYQQVMHAFTLKKRMKMKYSTSSEIGIEHIFH